MMMSGEYFFNKKMMTMVVASGVCIVGKGRSVFYNKKEWCVVMTGVFF